MGLCDRTGNVARDVDEGVDRSCARRWASFMYLGCSTQKWGFLPKPVPFEACGHLQALKSALSRTTILHSEVKTFRRDDAGG